MATKLEQATKEQKPQAEKTLSELSSSGAGPEVAVSDPTNEPENQLVEQEDPGQTELSWVASEYLHNEKSFVWYIGLLFAGLLIGALTYLITKEVFSAAIGPIVAIIVGVFAARKPQEVSYEITENGIFVGSRYNSFKNFKTFTVIHEGEYSSLMLQPVKRFLPPIAVYFTPDNAEKVMDVLGKHMPHEEGKIDAVERLARHLRF